MRAPVTCCGALLPLPVDAARRRSRAWRAGTCRRRGQLRACRPACAAHAWRRARSSRGCRASGWRSSARRRRPRACSICRAAPASTISPVGISGASARAARRGGHRLSRDASVPAAILGVLRDGRMLMTGTPRLVPGRGSSAARRRPVERRDRRLRRSEPRVDRLVSGSGDRTGPWASPGIRHRSRAAPSPRPGKEGTCRTRTRDGTGRGDALGRRRDGGRRQGRLRPARRELDGQTRGCGASGPARAARRSSRWARPGPRSSA